MESMLDLQKYPTPIVTELYQVGVDTFQAKCHCGNQLFFKRQYRIVEEKMEPINLDEGECQQCQSKIVINFNTLLLIIIAKNSQKENQTLSMRLLLNNLIVTICQEYADKIIDNNGTISLIIDSCKNGMTTTYNFSYLFTDGHLLLGDKTHPLSYVKLNKIITPNNIKKEEK